MRNNVGLLAAGAGSMTMAGCLEIWISSGIPSSQSEDWMLTCNVSSQFCCCVNCDAVRYSYVQY